MADNLVICMKWGVRYGRHYANRLYSMVSRNHVGPVHFVCFTDDAEGLDPGIDARPLPPLPNVPEQLAFTPWRKMSVWSGGLDGDLLGRDALFLDLDLVVVGDITPMFAYEPGEYVAIENWTKMGQGIANTSVFRVQLGKHGEIFDEYIEDPMKAYHDWRIEQQFISGRLIALYGLAIQKFWPSPWCRSFKEELLPSWPQRFWQVTPLPEDARIVVFHGKPDPDDALVGRWPAPPWKKTYKTIRPTPWIGEHWR